MIIAPVSGNSDSAATPATFRYFSKWLFLLSGAWLVAYIAICPDPVALASRNWPLVVVGVLGAFIGNLTAIGGGIVFIPVLMLVYKTDPVSALKLTFVTQAVGMTSGASGWVQRGDVPARVLRWTVPALAIGALFATFVVRPHPALVKCAFGPVSIFAGVATLLSVFRGNVGQPSLPTRARFVVALLAIAGGVISGWVAIGEGEVVAASCMLLYGLAPNRAIGLGVTLLAINSILLALIYALFIGGIPWDMAAFTCLGVLWGGRLAPYCAQRISLRGIKISFALIAIADGLLIAIQAMSGLARNRKAH